MPTSQRIEESLGVLQVSGVKALGEPAVDRGEQRVGLSPLALLLPQARQAHGRPQLQGLCVLAASNRQGLVQARLCCRRMVRRLHP
jgi:hypothetical protein